ncbi:hypothetical protein IQ17_03416 [Bradyrhizobium daqingense]|uniref:Uncharacterized protein n=2 Tax=Bradyrhizobium daqingense TaxID=993502 RepID=A0A562LC97_9BRAD|nr:hypothetical protein IQ17_03416 [Bradyrhizobium daqingense]
MLPRRLMPGWGGATSGEFSMSGHLRSYFSCLVLVGSLSAAPACANPFADLFNIAPREPAATPSAQPECMPRPGNSPGVGQRWVYRRDGHRKCWFLAEGIPTVRKPVHGRVTNRAASLDDEAARRGRSPMIDARAELPSSSPAERAPTPPVGEVKVADASSVFDAGTPALMPAAPVTDLPSGQLTPERAVPLLVEVEKLSESARADSPAVPMGARDEEVHDDARSRMATWLGVLLMTVGGFSMLSSSRALRHAVRLRH